MSWHQWHSPAGGGAVPAATADVSMTTAERIKAPKKNETGDWSRFALAVRIYNRAINRYTIIRALSS
jgi:hypothetical protein